MTPPRQGVGRRLTLAQSSPGKSHGPDVPNPIQRTALTAFQAPSGTLRSRGGASQQVSLPVEDQAELVAKRLGVLLVDDVGARAEPEPLEEGRPEQCWAIVDREVILRLVGRRLSRGRVNGIRAPGEVEVGAQAWEQRPREVVSRADQPGFLVGLVEVLVDHRKKARKASPWALDGIAGAGD